MEDFMDELDELILKYKGDGMTDDEVMSVLEMALNAMKEEQG